MADTSWGVKVSAETKEHTLQLIAESGLSAREFFRQLLLVWEANKPETIIESDEFFEIAQLTSRINGLSAEILAREATATKELKDELQTKQQEVVRLQMENERLVKENQEQADNFKNQISELNNMLIRFQKYEVDYHEITLTVAELRNDLNTSAEECKNLKNKLTSMIEQHKSDIEKLEQLKKQELELLAEKKGREIEKKIHKVTLEYQAKLEAIKR